VAFSLLLGQSCESIASDHLEQSMGARNRVGTGRSGPPAYVAWRAGTTTLFTLGSYSPPGLF